jgi:hypothetical protein
MKKVIAASCFCLLVFFFVSESVANVYVVRAGDNLVKIAKKTKSTVGQLAILNEIRNPARIFPGQAILYVSRRDLEHARLWAEKTLKELPPEDQKYRYFSLVSEDIQAKNIKYLPVDSSGTQALSILVFSQAWKEHRKKHPQL